MPHISYTEIKDLMRCRQKWEYAWWEELKPRARPVVMDVGALGHSCLEYYYGGKNWQAAIDVAEAEAKELANDDEYIMENFYDAMHTVADIIPNYLRYAKENDPYFAKQVLAVEHKGEVLVPGFKKTMLGFKWDLVTLAQDKRVYLWEHKFVKQAPGGYEYLEYDFQTHTYLWAMRELGLFSKYGKVEGILFNLIRFRPTRKEPDKWVIRERTYRTPEQLDLIGQELSLVALERNNIRNALRRGDGALIYRHMMRGCLDCVFRQVCLGEQKGIDMTALRAEQFTHKEQ